MGVRGLSTFIDNNQKLLSVQKLHDTKVVIDGNNLYHFLYYQYHIVHQYGGDYDHFSRKCKRFFSLLGKCGVEPIVVFDGGYGPDDRKLPTILSRLRDRLSTAESICKTGHGKIIPILAIETFRLVLVELNIPHVACEFEADDDIATLANDLNCPVLSNDSDFFVYDLTAGYIPLDYMNLTLCVHNPETAEESICTKDKVLNNSEYRYLPVKFYHRDRLAELFSNKSAFVIPLFATLLGNDYLSTADLALFYAQLQIPRSSKKYFFSSKSQNRLASLIQWLNENKESDLDTFVDFVVENCGKEETNLREEICRSVKSYCLTTHYGSVDLKDFLGKLNGKTNKPKSSVIENQENQTITNYKDKTETGDNDSHSVTDYHGNHLPSWFVEKLRKCEIHPHVQNAAILHRVILPCQVEIITDPSTYQCSRAIREIIYGILFQSDAHTSDRLSQDNCVVEYDRDQKNTKKMYVAPAPAEEVAHGNSLPTLISIVGLTLQDRQLLLLNVLGLSKGSYASFKDSGFYDDLVLMIGLMIFWINHAMPKILSAHLDSFILGMIAIQTKSLKWIEERKLIGLEYVEPNLYKQITQAFYDSSDKQIERFDKNVEKYFEKPHHSSKNPANFKIVHGFSQLQACLRDVINLNQLLLCPFTEINPSVILNCTLLYNLCSEIDVRANSELFILEMLDRGSPLCQTFSSIKKQVMLFCSNTCFVEVAAGRSSNSKKKKSKSKKKDRKQVGTTVHKDEKKEEKGEEKKLKLVTNCSVNNRFAMLDLDD